MEIKSHFQKKGYTFVDLPDDYEIRNEKDILFKVIRIPDSKNREGFYYLEFTNKDAMYATHMKMSKTVLINPALDKGAMDTILREVEEFFIVHMDEFWFSEIDTPEMIKLISQTFTEILNKEPKSEVIHSNSLSQLLIEEDEHYQKTTVTVYPLNRLYFAIKFEVASQEYMVNLTRMKTEAEEESLKKVIREVVQDGYSRKEELFNFEVLKQRFDEELRKICLLNEPVFQDEINDHMAAGQLAEDDCVEFRSSEFIINFYDLEEFKFVHLLIDNVFLTNEYFLSAENLLKFALNLQVVLKETETQILSAAESIKNPKSKEVTFQDILNEIKEEVGERMFLEKEEDGRAEFWAKGRPAIILKEDKQDDNVMGYFILMKNLLLRDMTNSTSKEYYIYPENGFDQLEFMKPSLEQYIESLHLETLEMARPYEKVEGLASDGCTIDVDAGILWRGRVHVSRQTYV